jgi:tRNA (mo5U34)-methyltransferase
MSVVDCTAPMNDSHHSTLTLARLGFEDIQRLIGDDVCLVISGPDLESGGVFAISRGEWEIIDTVPTIGLAFDGNRFARSMRLSPAESVDRLGEIVWYDERGMMRMERIDRVEAVHDIMFDPSDPDALLLVSTGTNAVQRLRPNRPLETILSPGARGDGGHRNCLARHSGLAYVTAFSTMADHREWDQNIDTDTGVLIEVETGRVIIEGLCRPHSPLRTAADDGWIIANSGRGELVWVSDDGERSALDVGDWPQDVIRCGDHLIVGVNPSRPDIMRVRTEMSAEFARLLIVEESSRSIVGMAPIPVKAYDLVVAPETMVDGLRIGTATNGLRLMDRSLRVAMSAPFSPTDDNGPEDHFGEVVVTGAPATVIIGDDISISVRVVYRGTRRGKTFGNTPIRLGLRWLESGEDARRYFQSILIPDRAIDYEMVIDCPPTTGRHTLEISLLQETVAWFGTAAVVELDVIDERPVATIEPAISDDLVAGLVGAAARREQKLADVASVEHWWHSIDLGDGVVTPGHKYPALIAQEWEDLDLPPLTGKSVLDIGAWDGYFSFTSERMGADRVVAVDDWKWALRSNVFAELRRQLVASGRSDPRLRDRDELWDREGLPGKVGFDVCHRHLSSGVQTIVANYMDLDPDEVGTFDVVLYLGVLYHEPNPLASLECVRALTRGVAVVETSALFVPGGEDLALAEFYPSGELNDDITNWWSPNAKATCGMARAAGFSRTRITKSYPSEWDTLPAGHPPLLYRLMLHCYVD